MDKVKSFFRHLATLIGAVLVSPLAAFAQEATSPDISAQITSAQTTILGYIAAWGAAFIAVCLAGVGWKVGGKLIKRMAGGV